MTSSIGGSIVIENVFALPGLGSLMVQSVSSRDFPLIQSLVFFIATMVILINFAVDVLYQVIDPRIQIGSKFMDYPFAIVDNSVVLPEFGSH